MPFRRPRPSSTSPERPIVEPQVFDARREVRPPRQSAFRARLTVRLRANRLDRALAAGVEPDASPQLSARAEMLRSRRGREAIAAGIYRTVKDAGVGRPAFSVRVPVARQAVSQNRRELLELAAELRQASEVSARGVAATRLLLVEGTGPLHLEEEHGALRAAVLRARSWL